ncbi:MAG: tyrosine-protein phosphatase [Pseudomonadota bacterium]
MAQQQKPILKRLERAARGAFGNDVSTPWARALTWFHFQVFDHAFLRGLWTNFDTVADGVYRSNHPGPGRLKRYKAMGVRSVLNLRGERGQAPWILEEEACRALGLNLYVAKIYARKAARRDELVRLIDTMRVIEKPFVMHCKSGADRAGFASVLYAHVIDGQPLAEARRHLHWSYAHLSATRTGIVDHVLDMYEARAARSPISLEDWLRTEYTKRDVAVSFAKLRGKTPPPLRPQTKPRTPLGPIAPVVRAPDRGP